MNTIAAHIVTEKFRIGDLLGESVDVSGWGFCIVVDIARNKFNTEIYTVYWIDCEQYISYNIEVLTRHFKMV